MITILMIALMALSETTEQLNQPSIWKVEKLERGMRRGRILFSADPILAKLAEDPNYIPDWEEEAKIDENGDVKHDSLRNGWAYTEYESDKDQTVLLEGGRFRYIFVNGEPFIGDYYGMGYLRIPIPLKNGINRIFVRSGRGNGFNIKLIPAEGTCSISTRDRIMPHMRENALIDSYGAVIILNHTDQFIKDAIIEVGDDKVFKKESTQVNLLPYGLAKPPLKLTQLRQPNEDELKESVYQLPITLTHGDTKQSIEIPLTVRQIGQLYNMTKISEIDGSVQYYAVLPPTNFDPEKDYSLYLTLHGAGVEATGQAASYSAKENGFVVAPTNRRPFGFDWQEWGRIDALETLDAIRKKHKIDPQRIYLTGHSMGGHGTWYLGVVYPSLFAAIGPSAGWISFFSYTRMSRSSDDEESNINLSPFEWAQMESDTFGLIENYTDLPIYILHGEKDDNVPAREARKMVEELSKFHKDFAYHEQPGVGHWWDDGPDPGVGCVDWKPMFDFFNCKSKLSNPLSVIFKTPNPSISATRDWVTIYSQITPSKFSSVSANADDKAGTINIKTDNVGTLMLSLNDLLTQEKANITIDDSAIVAETGKDIYLFKQEGEDWKVIDPPDPKLKGLHRNGPFKMAFDKNMVWVYGTHGSDEENAALLAKVRFEAQTWWYFGNGNVTIIPDSEFEIDKFAGRNIILYGNEVNNSAFGKLLKDCPISVRADNVGFGEGGTFHNDLGASGVFFVYPRPESNDNLIGVVGMTNTRAVRMNFIPGYFTSGVACPDYVIFNSHVLSKGMRGVMEAGYFDNEWKLEVGE